MDSWLVALISGSFLILGALIAYFGGRRYQKSQALSTDIKSIGELLSLVDGLVAGRAKDRERMDEMQVLIDALGRRIDGWESRWVEVKRWFDLFIAWVDEKGYSGYPPIPKSIKERDTHDKMKPVK